MRKIITCPSEPTLAVETPEKAQVYFMLVNGLSYVEQCVELSNVMSAKFNLMQTSMGWNDFSNFENRQALVTDLTDKVLLLLMAVIGREPIFAKYGMDLRSMNQDFHVIDAVLMELELQPDEYGHELYKRFALVLGIDYKNTLTDEFEDQGGLEEPETEENEIGDDETCATDEFFLYEDSYLDDEEADNEPDYESYDAYVTLLQQEESSFSWLEMLLDSDDSLEAEQDYQLLLEAPYIVFLLVAFADEEMDKEELACMADIVINYERLENKQLANVIRDSVSERSVRQVSEKISTIIAQKPNYSQKLEQIREIIEKRLEPADAYRFKKDLILLGFQIASASTGRHSFGRKVCDREKQRLRRIAAALGVS